MANSRAFSDLKSGQCSSVVEARLLRFWEARNVKCGGEIKWMDLLMVDVKVSDFSCSILCINRSGLILTVPLLFLCEH